MPKALSLLLFSKCSREFHRECRRGHVGCKFESTNGNPNNSICPPLDTKVTGLNNLLLRAQVCPNQFMASIDNSIVLILYLTVPTTISNHSKLNLKLLHTTKTVLKVICIYLEQTHNSLLVLLLFPFEFFFPFLPLRLREEGPEGFKLLTLPDSKKNR